jgi:hypothetical protein
MELNASDQSAKPHITGLSRRPAHPLYQAAGVLSTVGTRSQPMSCDLSPASGVRECCADLCSVRDLRTDTSDPKVAALYHDHAVAVPDAEVVADVIRQSHRGGVS